MPCISEQHPSSRDPSCLPLEFHWKSQGASIAPTRARGEQQRAALPARACCFTGDRLCHRQQPLRLRLRRQQDRHEGVGRGLRLNESRAEEQLRPALRPAARRPACPPRIGLKRRGDRVRQHARNVRAVWVGQTGCGPALVLRPALLERNASSRVATHCCSLGHGEREAGGRMRRAVHVNVGRKRHGTVDYVRTICIEQHGLSKLGRAVVLVQTLRRGII